MEKTPSKNLRQTKEIAKNFIDKLTEKKEATIVGLSGDLGSGKTTFTKFIASLLGVSENVTSPTFVIEKIYKIKHPFFRRLVHIDAYRLESAAELEKLGFREIIKNKENLVIIEWPEKVRGILPKDTYIIKFEYTNPNNRKISLPKI